MVLPVLNVHSAQTLTSGSPPRNSDPGNSVFRNWLRGMGEGDFPFLGGFSSAEAWWFRVSGVAFVNGVSITPGVSIALDSPGRVQNYRIHA